MRKEWRENVWLIIELAVVCMAIWVLSFMLYALTEGLFTPRGYNPDNVYALTNNTVPKESADYIELEGDEEYFADFQALLGRLRDNEHVEAVTFHWGGLPYNFNFQGRNLVLAEEPDTIGYFGNTRTVSPDYIKVLGIESKTGATQEQLIEMLRRGDVLISDDNYQYESQGLNPYDLKGKKVIFGNDSSYVMRVGDIIQKVRRNDYELSYGGTILLPMPEKDRWGEVAVRVKDGHGKQFEEDFKNKPELRKQRNIYLSDLRSLMDIREANQRSTEVDVRLYSVMVVFLLATVFLGLLGTFWFRMQQRVSEIAIRKVAGATKAQVFRRILSEGMVLLAGAVVITSAVVWTLVYTDSDITDMGIDKTTVLIMEGVTVVLMAIGIVLSLWWPAKKAMAIEPAIAIKDE